MRGVLALLAILIATPAEAYIGPGLGLGTLGAILGVAAAFALAIVAVIWYPIKRMLRRARRRPRTGGGK